MSQLGGASGEQGALPPQARVRAYTHPGVREASWVGEVGEKAGVGSKGGCRVSSFRLGAPRLPVAAPGETT